MAHINKLIDFTIGAYIVHKGKVLFIHHKELNTWFQIGGHIELDEEPEQALYREIEEETGLTKKDIVVMSTKPDFKSEIQRHLYTPNFMDFHKINEGHWHVGIVYFVKSKTSKVKLERDFHHEIRWLNKNELRQKKYGIRDDIAYSAEKAIELEKSFK